MINLILATFAVSILLIILWYALPFLIIVAVISVAVYLVKWIFSNNLAGIREAAENDRLIVARADRQHQQIMEGDEDAGTYGKFPPAL
jgi:hypothetical protein